MLCHCVPLSIFLHVCWVVVTPTVKPYLDKSLWTREMFQTGNVKQKQRDPVRRLLLARDVCRFAKCCLLASWLILAKDVEPLNVFSSNCSSLVTECSICYTMYTMSMDCILMSHKMSLCNVHVIDVLANVSVVSKNCLAWLWSSYSLWASRVRLPSRRTCRSTKCFFFSPLVCARRIIYYSWLP